MHHNFELAHQSQPILIRKKKREKALLTANPFNKSSSPPWFFKANIHQDLPYQTILHQ